MRKTLLLITGLFIALQLQSCAAPVIVAGAATGASIANDRRSAGTILEDQAIELKISNAIYGDKSFPKDTHISVVSFNNVVLLLGQTPTGALREHAENIAKQTENVKRLHNEISIGDPTSYRVRNNDAWITTKVKSTLLGTEGVGATHIKVITENGIVYLMGIVTRNEGQQAAEAVQHVKGVRGIYKVFDYLD